MRPAFLLAAAVAAAPLHDARTQESPLPLGTRVRVTGKVPCPLQNICVGGRPTFGPTIGQVLSFASDTLVLAVTAGNMPLVVPRSEIGRLELHRGTKSAAGHGAAIGSLAGVIPGLVIGLLTYHESVVPCDLFCGFGGFAGPETAAVGGVLAGVLVGAVGGALIGTAVRVDRWEEVPLQTLWLGILPATHRWLALTASLKF